MTRFRVRAQMLSFWVSRELIVVLWTRTDMVPMPRMMLIPTFFLTSICSLQSIGIGRTTMVVSANRLTMAV